MDEPNTTIAFKAPETLSEHGDARAEKRQWRGTGQWTMDGESALELESES